MKFWDYHTHHERCHHAIGRLEEYIQSAIEKNLVEIGLSDHFPMELLPEEANVWKYAMSEKEFPIYLKEAKNLQQKYKSQIKVRISTEIDYYPEVFEEYKKKIHPYFDEFDYLLGSIHVIKLKNSTAFGVDEEIAKEISKKRGIDAIYLEYYDRIIRLVKTGYFNILGHMDLPKKWGERPQNHELVWEKILTVLDTIESSNMSVEINHAGLIKPVQEQYPSDPIIQELIDRKIAINFSSDSHDPKTLGYHFEDTLKKVKKMGLTHLCKWEKKEKRLITI